MVGRTNGHPEAIAVDKHLHQSGKVDLPITQQQNGQTNENRKETFHLLKAASLLSTLGRRLTGGRWR